MTFPTAEQQQEGEQGAAVSPAASGGCHALTQQPEEEGLRRWDGGWRRGS